MTLAQLREQVRYQLGLPTGTATDTMIDARLNEGYRDLLSRSRCTVRVCNLTLTAGVTQYDIPALIALIAINGTFSDDLRRIEPLGLNDLIDRNAAESVGTPGYYSIQGSDLLLLYPEPSAGDTLTFYYVPLPDMLTSPGSDDEEFELVPAEHHSTIEAYALWKMADSRRGEATSGQGKLYEGDYEKGVVLLRQALRRKQGAQKSRVTVNRRRRLVPHTRDQDLRL